MGQETRVYQALIVNGQEVVRVFDDKGGHVDLSREAYKFMCESGVAPRSKILRQIPKPIVYVATKSTMDFDPSRL